jgi:hypothetical protein
MFVGGRVDQTPAVLTTGPMSGCGPRLPTWAAQQVGSYPGYTGRTAKVVAKAARDPQETLPRFEFDKCGAARSRFQGLRAAYAILVASAIEIVLAILNPHALAPAFSPSVSS